jgi:hypothetical protein
VKIWPCGGAEGGSDYLPALGSLTFAPGQLTQQVAVAVVGDRSVEFGQRIEPQIGSVLAMERAEEAFRAMWEGKTRGKTVFTR